MIIENADDTFCKVCGGLIATGKASYIKELKKCSFPVHLIGKCNDCATIEDMTNSLKYYEENYPKHKTSISPEMFRKVMEQIRVKYPHLK